MKNFLLSIAIFLFFSAKSFGHVDHYSNFNYLEYELLRNNKPIGYHKFEFTRKGEKLTIKSEVKFKIKNNKGKLKIILESANADFEIDDDQSERFMDKDWETETITPTLMLTDESKKEEYVTYDGGHLFTLEVAY